MIKSILISSAMLLAGCSMAPDDSVKNIDRLIVTNDWQTQATDAYRGKRDDISFATPTHGWYGTGKGDLFATQDGGLNWNLIASRPGTFIRALGFLNEKTGFIGNVGTEY